MQYTAKQNYPGLVAFYDTRPGNEVGLFYSAATPTVGQVLLSLNYQHWSTVSVFSCILSAMTAGWIAIEVYHCLWSGPCDVSRYIICQGKRPDSEPIQRYLFLLNERMCQIWPGVIYSSTDIREIVPYDILRQDEQFFQYVYNSNVRCVAWTYWPNLASIIYWIYF